MSFAFAVIPSPPITLSVTSPDVPPPVKPDPATTLSISPASFVKLNAPVPLLYDKSPPALNNPLITELAMPNVPELAVRFVPAIPDTKSAMLSFLLPFESFASIIATLSFATSTVAAVNSFRSSANETVPLEPPPLKPFPAVTPSMSPASFVKLITPVVLLYDKSPLALNNALTDAFVNSMSFAFTVIPYPAPTANVASPEVASPVKPAPATMAVISPSPSAVISEYFASL